jgi:hypothetical protein
MSTDRPFRPWPEVLSALTLKPRHKWFSAACRESEEWDGPWNTIEDAALAMASEDSRAPIYVAHGYKMTKAEREDWGAEHDWQVNAEQAIQINIPLK